MIERQNCLLENNRLLSNIDNLTNTLKEDFFLTGLKACTQCGKCDNKEEVINLHCQLQSIHSILIKIGRTLQNLIKE